MYRNESYKLSSPRHHSIQQLTWPSIDINFHKVWAHHGGRNAPSWTSK